MGIKPEGKFKDELLEELVEKELNITKEREKLKASTKVQRGRIGALEERKVEILELLEGKAGAQAPLPLTKANGKKGAPPPLKWGDEGENLVARVEDGTYCIQPFGAGPFFDLHWTPKEGRSRRVVGALASKEEGKKAAEHHQAERAADALLENAGDGRLTKADTKGPATAYRKGTRRGGAASRGLDR